MDKDKKKKYEVRFLLKEKIYNKLKEKAENCDVGIASYAKVKLEKELK
jgi:hypothetical protein